MEYCESNDFICCAYGWFCENFDLLADGMIENCRDCSFLIFPDDDCDNEQND